LVERVSFLGLLACPVAYRDAVAKSAKLEREGIGGHAGGPQKAASKSMTPAEAKRIKARFPRPALGKLLLYKPGMEVPGALGPVTRSFGGVTAPPVLMRLIGQLPRKFTGERTDVGRFMSLLVRCPIPPAEGAHPSSGNTNGAGQRQQGLGGAKRKFQQQRQGGTGDGEENEGPLGSSGLALSSQPSQDAPSNDIYRKRRKQKMGSH
jgi:hypothetical protein